MLVDYTVTEMGCFDDYLDNAPHGKIMRENFITNFLLHVYRCITFNQMKFVTGALIAEAQSKSIYSSLGFKFIKDFATSPNLEKARKQFCYESVKSKALQKKTISLQCYLTIPRCVTILHDNRIEFNENKYLFKYLNEVRPSDDCFPYKYIDAEVNKKLDKSKGRLAGEEMEN